MTLPADAVAPANPPAVAVALFPVVEAPQENTHSAVTSPAYAVAVASVPAVAVAEFVSPVTAVGVVPLPEPAYAEAVAVEPEIVAVAVLPELSVVVPVPALARAELSGDVARAVAVFVSFVANDPVPAWAVAPANEAELAVAELEPFPA
ncbi:MAG TPA: hypothetical protein VND62_05480 [Acidimicrobiales bacterium]|nr:hypothetical protein [Acidimicrobiales bacterium]